MNKKVILPPENYTFEQLQEINESRIVQAEDAGVFDKLRTVGRCLGTQVASYNQNHGVYFIYAIWPSKPIPVMPIVVVYREKTGRLVKPMGEVSVWENIEEVLVFLGPEDYSFKRLDSLGNPLFYKGLRVCKYQRSSHPSGNEEKFIAPGQWVEAVLEHHPAAQEIEQRMNWDHKNTARDELYRKMLLDREI